MITDALKNLHMLTLELDDWRWVQTESLQLRTSMDRISSIWNNGIKLCHHCLDAENESYAKGNKLKNVKVYLDNEQKPYIYRGRSAILVGLST